MTATPYVICGECGMVYLTAKDLFDAYERAVAKLDFHVDKPCLAADEIGFCQECLHDF